MRHFLLSCPIAALSFGVGETSTATGLITASGGADRSVPRVGGAGGGAVDLAAITAAANRDV